MLLLSAPWRQRQLQRRLAVWEPRIGSEATVTATRSIVYRQVLTVLVNAWLILSLVDLILLHRNATVEAVISTISWPVVIVCGVQSVRLLARAQHQAATLVATRPDAGVPVRRVERFDEWKATNRYSKAAQGQ